MRFARGIAARRSRPLALFALLALALQASVPSLHAMGGLPSAGSAHASARALWAADATLLAAASHDAADCPVCRELARSRAADLPAPALAWRSDRIDRATPFAPSPAAPWRAPDSSADPRAPPAAASPTA